MPHILLLHSLDYVVVQSIQISWQEVLEYLQQLPPFSWVWTALVLFVPALLLVLDIGDKLSGIFGWLGIDSSFFTHRREQYENDDVARDRLLQFVEHEVSTRLRDSLHNQVKLDLYMEAKKHEKTHMPGYAMIPEDPIPTASKQPLKLKFTQDIVDVFSGSDIQQKLLILGEPGTGKTIELLSIANELITQAKADSDKPIPVILELSEWTDEPIERWISSYIRQRLDRLKQTTIQQWLEEHQLVLLLDGLDELSSSNQENCTVEINKFVVKYRPRGLLVCCRRKEYENNRLGIEGLNGSICLSELRNEQIENYFRLLNRSSLWPAVRDTPKLLELARKPLYLSLLVLAYQGQAIQSIDALFDAYIQKQLRQPIKKSHAYGRKLTYDRAINYLTSIAHQLQWNHGVSVEFSAESITSRLSTSSLLKSEQRTHSFYLSECAVSSASGLINGIVFGLGSRFIPELTDALGFWLLSLLILILAVVCAFMFLIQPRIIATAIFSLHGLIFGTVFILASDVENTFAFCLLFMLMSGLPIIPLFLFLSLSLDEEASYSYTAKLESIFSLIFQICSYLTLCLAFGMVVGFIFGFLNWASITNSHTSLLRLEDGFLFGAISGFCFGLTFYTSVCLIISIRYFVLRILLVKHNQIPFNWTHFLEYAVERRILQKVGHRYRFIHDLLREHFYGICMKASE